MKQVSNSKVFGGELLKMEHEAHSTRCTMRFCVYLPPKALQTQSCPVVYWLSGLTCTEDNFMQKAGAQRLAAELGIILVAPDTSPRGDDVPDVDGYDFGTGAGFYVNATQSPWSSHFHMYDYVVHELPQLIDQNFNTTGKQSIMGHSMGGHGALMIGLRNQTQYASISAFSPIVNPMDCAWGVKALTGYLGADSAIWQDYDATEVLKKSGCELPLMIEQGLADEFLKDQLKPDNFVSAAKERGVSLQYNAHESYDHSYYFIASFIEKHLQFHAQCLNV